LACRGRSALLWAGGLFLLLQFLGGLVLDYAWTAVRFPTAARLLAYLETRPKAPDIVCLGSSRFGLGLHAPEVGWTLAEEFGHEGVGVFNASVEAGDFISAEFMLRHLLQKGVRPKLALIEVSPDALHRKNPWMYYHVRRQLCWDDVPAFLPDAVRAKQARRLVLARLLPLYVHRVRMAEELAARRLPVPAPANPYGFQGDDLAWAEVLGVHNNVQHVHRPDWVELGAAGARKSLQNYTIGGRSPAALERLLCQCREQGIQAILVGVPVTSVHREIYTPAVETAFLSHVERLTRTYACTFVDYRAAVPDRLFWDNHHLLEAGREVFTRKLTREVIAPAWHALRAP